VGWSVSSFAEEPTDYSVDSIRDLPSVRDISIGGEEGTLLVTMPNKILRFSTFPLRVTADVDLDFEGISSALSSDDTLVVLGEHRSPELTGGTIQIYPDVGKSLTEQVAPIGTDLGTTPFSQALLTSDLELFAVNPTWHSIIQASVPEIIKVSKTDDVFRTNNLFLTCGPASKVSVFDYDVATDSGRESKRFYVTSVTGDKQIEYGPIKLNAREYTGSACFKPGGVTRSKTKSARDLGRQALLHEVIDNPWSQYDPDQPAKWLLAFDPDQHDLALFPIREDNGKLVIRRSEGTSVNLADEFDKVGVPRGKFGLMSASDGASVILISHIGSKFVHRLKRVENGLEYLGYSEVPEPVRMLRVAKNGSLAAMVSGDSRKDVKEELILLKNPSAIDASGALRKERFSVVALQEALVVEGQKLNVDGIYGSETSSAVNALSTDGAATASISSGTNSSDTGTLPIDERVRGVFPFGFYGPSR
jgi:hypothetical protein